MKHAHTARHPPQVAQAKHNLLKPNKTQEEASRNKVSILESVLGRIKV